MDEPQPESMPSLPQLTTTSGDDDSSEKNEHFEAEVLGSTSRASKRGVVFTATYYEGALPPPEYLAQFDKIVPGSAKRIVGSALRQTVHRQTNENKIIQSNIEVRALAMKLGAALSGLTIMSGAAFAFFGYPAYGASIIATTAVALATSLLHSSAGQRKELAAKRSEMDKLEKQSKQPTS